MAELAPNLDALYRAAHGLTGNSADAQDLVQDSALKALRSLHTFTPGTNFKAWIYRVLYTTFLTGLRKKRAAEVELDHDPGVAPSGRQRLAEHLEHATHAERVAAILEASDDELKHALQTLPPDLRLVFTLNTIEGLKYREIADVMGCPIGTVMSRLFRSRKLLQDQLAGYARERGWRDAAELEAAGA